MALLTVFFITCIWWNSTFAHASRVSVLQSRLPLLVSSLFAEIVSGSACLFHVFDALWLIGLRLCCPAGGDSSHQHGRCQQRLCFRCVSLNPVEHSGPVC